MKGLRSVRNNGLGNGFQHKIGDSHRAGGEEEFGKAVKGFLLLHLIKFDAEIHRLSMTER